MNNYEVFGNGNERVDRIYIDNFGMSEQEASLLARGVHTLSELHDDGHYIVSDHENLGEER